jgi:outer membrane protein
MNGIKVLALAAVAGLALAGPAATDDLFKDKLYVKVGVTGMLPDESDNVSAIGGGVDISYGCVPTLNLECYFTPDVSAQLFCCIAPHKVAAVNTALGRVNLGEITLFPPTVPLKKHCELGGGVTPLVGAGVNHTHFFNDE